MDFVDELTAALEAAPYEEKAKFEVRLNLIRFSAGEDYLGECVRNACATISKVRNSKDHNRSASDARADIQRVKNAGNFLAGKSN